MTVYRGHARLVGDDVSTDEILPGRYMTSSDPAVLARHALEGVAPHFAERVTAGDILVAGRNFGTGSSRESAPRALQLAGFGAVIATSFARIFFRNCINIGLPVFWVAAATSQFAEGDEVEIAPATGRIANRTTGIEVLAQPLPAFVLEISRHGGLVDYAKSRIGEPLVPRVVSAP